MFSCDNRTNLPAAAMLLLSFTASSSGAEVLPSDVRERVSGELVYYDASGGATTRARQETISANFESATDVSVRSDFNANMTKFFAAMDSGSPIRWSLIEFPTEADFLRARDKGYLRKLDREIVDVSKLNDTAHDEYGVRVLRYGIVLTYNTEQFSGDAAPQSVRDLYDTDRFPGKRCLFKYPQFGGVLESALLADGVKRENLYPLDVDRAFNKLDTIKEDIRWWENGDDAIRLLLRGECSIGIAWSGRVYGAVTNDDAPLAVKWNESLYANAVYAVPKGAPNEDAGQAYIAQHISDIEGQKALVKGIPYTTDIKDLDTDDYADIVQPWIVAGENAEMAIQQNPEFYRDNINELVERFNRWLVLD